MGNKEYTVNLWGSKPGEDDDCWAGLDFDTREEAVKAFQGNARELHILPAYDALAEGSWLEIDGPDIHEERQLKRGEWELSKHQARLYDFMEASERLWEGRMLHGLAWES